ncbi:MAG: ATP-binding protein [Eubacterium sp.]|nr:ATP-binding protein [Eubacterium sp.]
MGDESKRITVEAVLENVEKVTEFVNQELEQLGCSVKTQMQIDVAIDELFGNIANYAYHPQKGGMATIEVSKSAESPAQVAITFQDQGKPYNPLEKEDPDITLGAAERPIGGLGIFLVKKTMDDIAYEYRDGKNILTIKKNL